MNLQQTLKKYGKSYTPERESIFQFISGSMPRHFDAQALFNEMKKQGASRASIFRAVALFEEIGILRKIDYKDGRAIYELQAPENHHEHMHCNVCKEIIEFEDKEVDDFLEKVAKKYHFTLKEHILSVFGICEKCGGK